MTLKPLHGDDLVPLLKKIAASSAVGLGQYGAEVIADTETHPGNFSVLHALTDVVFDTVVAPCLTGTLTAVTLKAGDKLFGAFASIKLTSGTLVAYNAAP